METCKECELAIYCFSEPSTWIFRTKQEMDEKQAAIENCPAHRQAQVESERKRSGAQAG